jgi:hypothetical protein
LLRARFSARGRLIRYRKPAQLHVQIALWEQHYDAAFAQSLINGAVRQQWPYMSMVSAIPADTAKTMACNFIELSRSDFAVVLQPMAMHLFRCFFGTYVRSTPTLASRLLSSQ